MAAETSISVSELNQIVAEAILRDPRTRSVTVRGEVSAFKAYPSTGHWYFNLKDAESSVSCVMFRQNTRNAALRPKDGDSVVADGYVGVYNQQGRYQLYVTGMRTGGTGDQYIRLEELKRRLAAEGLFDPGRKKTIPLCPGKVAVVTSLSGAALQDILNVSRMRSPFIPIMLVHTAVQGAGAGAEIARGIEAANRAGGADVIIVARGGGSPEDLWCFNDEAVIRAVAASRLPVVSGIGHEIDTTLCDLAADVRASTPSNAAEIVFPDRSELTSSVGLIRSGLTRAMTEVVRGAQIQLSEQAKRLSALSPLNRIAFISNRRVLLYERLNAVMARSAEKYALRIGQAGSELTRRMENVLQRSQQRTVLLRHRLEAVNPFSVLARGFAMVYTGDRRLLTAAAQAQKEQEMILHFTDGEVHVTGKGTS